MHENLIKFNEIIKVVTMHNKMFLYKKQQQDLALSANKMHCVIEHSSLPHSLLCVAATIAGRRDMLSFAEFHSTEL